MAHPYGYNNTELYVVAPLIGFCMACLLFFLLKLLFSLVSLITFNRSMSINIVQINLSLEIGKIIFDVF
jgi:hypothetical protein